MDYVLQQISSGFLLFLGGMLWGGLLDVYRLFRRHLGKRGNIQSWITYSGDILFWIAAASLLFPIVYSSTWLRLRLYVWLFLILGAVMYRKFFSYTFLQLMCRLGRKKRK